MILTGGKIRAEVAAGRIVIEPFSVSLLNQHSYTVRLGNDLLRLDTDVLDVLAPPAARTMPIGDDGLVLEPRRVYLAHTVERLGSTHFVPILMGLRDLASLGLFVHVSADLGNLGAVHRWTLELVATQPIRLYPGIAVAQMCFFVTTGERVLYDGFLGRFSEPMASTAGLFGIERSNA